MSVKKLILSLAVIVPFSAYALFLRSGQNGAVLADQNFAAPVTSLPADNTKYMPSVSNPPVRKNMPKMAPKMPARSGAFRNDGTFTGDSVDAFYGNVQVAAVISGGRLVDVKFLDYPSDRSTSLRKSQMAMPILKSEAIRSQSARVNIVSGATSTSEAFSQSLSSALSEANA